MSYFVILIDLIKIIKLVIQILKSYDFTIQNMIDDSIHNSRQFYTFLLTSENLASLNHANKENKRYILLIANIVAKQLFFPIFRFFQLVILAYSMKIECNILIIHVCRILRFYDSIYDSILKVVFDSN